MDNLLTSTLQNVPQQRCVMWHAFSLATSMQHVSCAEQKTGQVVILWLTQVTCNGRIRNVTTQCVCKITSLQSYSWRQDFLHVKLHPYSLLVKAGLYACKITPLQSYPWRQDILSVKLHPYSLTHEGRSFACKITSLQSYSWRQDFLYVKLQYILRIYLWRQDFLYVKLDPYSFTCEGMTSCM